MTSALQKHKYIDGIRDLLRLFYGANDLKSAYRKKLDSKLEGFIAAGILTDLISKQDLQKVIDTADSLHFLVAPMTLNIICLLRACKFICLPCILICWVVVYDDENLDFELFLEEISFPKIQQCEAG